MRQERDILKVVGIFSLIPNRGADSSPQIHAELKDRHIHSSRKRVVRLMRGNGILLKPKKKFKATTDSKHSHPVASNLFQRNFEADMPNRKWLTDITFIWNLEGWLYLAAILKLFSDIVGRSMANRMSKRLELETLGMAAGHRCPRCC